VGGEDHTPHADDQAPTGRQRLSVAQAAEVLGISIEAVRGRIKRNTLRHERTPDGVVVFLNADQSTDRMRPGADQSTDQYRPDAREELVAELRDRVSYWERRLDEEREARTEERRRHDTLMAQLTSRIPQIEAPQASPESPKSPGLSPTPPNRGGEGESATDEQQGRGPIPEGTSPQTATERPEELSWWRRMFGG
jgi:hypothetical protein